MRSSAEESLSSSGTQSGLPEGGGRAVEGTIAIRSRRFGSYEVPCQAIVDMPDGLVGLPQLRRFVILDHREGSPFKWMLSVDDPELGFAVTDPSDLVPGYQVPQDAVCRALEAPPEAVAMFVLVTIPSNPLDMTLNLMAPVVVDLRTRRARQIVLDDPRWSSAHPVVARAVP